MRHLRRHPSGPVIAGARPRQNVRAGRSFGSALTAFIGGKPIRSIDDVKEALDTAIVAVSTKLMHWFRAAGRFFYAIQKNSRFEPVQFVSGLLALPCFKLSQLSFYFSTTALDRKIGRLGGVKFGLNFADCVGSSVSIGHLLKTLNRVNDLLERANARKDLAYHSILRLKNPANTMSDGDGGVQ